MEAELATVNATDAAAYGAALLAGVGIGAWSVGGVACKACVKIIGSTLPDASEQEAYRKSYPLYQELYPALGNTFVKM